MLLVVFVAGYGTLCQPVEISVFTCPYLCLIPCDYYFKPCTAASRNCIEPFLPRQFAGFALPQQSK
jgi:hypothetical protein